MLRAEITTRVSLSLQFSEHDIAATCLGQRMTPELVLVNHGSSLEKMRFGPIERFAGRFLMERCGVRRCGRMQGFAFGDAELLGPKASKLLRRNAAHFPVALLVRQVLANCLYIRTVELRMFFE